MFWNNDDVKKRDQERRERETRQRNERERAKQVAIKRQKEKKEREAFWDERKKQLASQYDQAMGDVLGTGGEGSTAASPQEPLARGFGSGPSYSRPNQIGQGQAGQGDDGRQAGNVPSVTPSAFPALRRPY